MLSNLLRYFSGFDGFDHVTMYDTVYFLNIQKKVAKQSRISILYLLYFKTYPYLKIVTCI